MLEPIDPISEDRDSQRYRRQHPLKSTSRAGGLPNLESATMCHRYLFRITGHGHCRLMRPENEIDFEDAYRATSELWYGVLMWFSDGTAVHLPSPAFEMYDAFDMGAFDHRNGTDPVAGHTVPMLAEILESVDAEPGA